MPGFWRPTRLRPDSDEGRSRANGAESLAVLPGALTRVSPNPGELALAMTSGGGSKDTWILSDGSALLPERSSEPREPVLADRLPAGLPSRAGPSHKSPPDSDGWMATWCLRVELRILAFAVQTISPRNHVHLFRLTSLREIDAEFCAWLAEAYSVGEQRHLAAKGQRSDPGAGRP